MLSAQHVETDKLSEKPLSGDLQLLLDQCHASHVRYLDSVHRRGKVLFSEGESARGVYLLRAGRAAVSISSSEGRVITLRMAHAGGVLGLNSVLRSSAYDTTVKAIEPCRTDFIPRADLLELMGTSQAGANAILNLLSHELDELTARTRSLLLPQTASARLAKLLLEWGRQSVRIDRIFTHEEIAQMICSSRETVTRLLASLSRRKIIEVNTDSIHIRDYGTLQKIALT
jgi:CRP/FNR family transcriptional regulator